MTTPLSESLSRGARRDRADDSHARPRVGTRAESGVRATILVVDDHPASREFLVSLLGYRGHRILEASDGREALELARAFRPDLAITDIVMPTMDGYEFARRMHSDPTLARTAVIFHTASYHQREAKALAAASGVPIVLTKPCDPELILRIVETVLSVSRPAVGHPVWREEFDRQHLRLVTDKLAQEVTAAEAAGWQLKALIDLGLELGSEQDPLRLFEKLCYEARKIVGAEYAAVGVLDDEGEALRHFLTSGWEAEIATRVLPPRPTEGVFGTLLKERRPLRLRNLRSDRQAAGLPPSWPLLDSFIGAPILSPMRVYGWLCLGNKLGADEFSDQDQAVVVILAAQMEVAYENVSRLAETERQAEELREEVAERKRAEAEIRALSAELERRLVEQTAQLEAANRDLEAFSYCVSRDLRAPLRSVEELSAASLEDHGHRLDAQARNYLERIRASSRNMSELIDDLLNLSQVTRSDLARQTVNLSDLARAIAAELQKTQPERQVEFSIAEGVLARGDPRLLRLALENLLGNAWKFTAKRPRPRIEFGLTERLGRAVYFVRDNGAGFDMACADKLFRPFERLHPVSEFPGAGIGLAIVERIVRRHAGRIWAEGVVNQGALFYLTLFAEGNDSG